MSTSLYSFTPEKKVLARVIVTQTPKSFFDYLLPAKMLQDTTALKGHLLTVPFAKGEKEAMIFQAPLPISAAAVPFEKLRHAQAWIDAPPLSSELCRFIERMGNYTMTPYGHILRMVLGPKKMIGKETNRSYFKIIDSFSQSTMAELTEAQSRIFSTLKANQPLYQSDLLKKSRSSGATLKKLLEKGIVEKIFMEPPLLPNPEHAIITLNTAQKNALQEIKNHFGKKQFSCLLLDGETGSGKTEIYFEALADILRAGKQVLILLPEIALSAQFVTRFEKRFGVRPALWHSALPLVQRRKTWHMLATHKISVLVGTRSALLLPFAQLGMIIVDEEHDSAYKQEEKPVYHARDMAVLRANCEHIPIVLSSATPTLESLTNADAGRYHHIRLKERYGGADFVDVRIVDLRLVKRVSQKWISTPIAEQIKATLEKKEQSLLFLNRRGYAPLLLCGSCGFRLKCPDCTAWLVEHRRSARLMCHHCGHHRPKPVACPHCQEKNVLIACGPGVERIEEECLTLFPQARITILTADTVSQGEDFPTLLKAIEDCEIDILIGTQVLAKGFHFPFLSFVGIIDADMSLDGGDLRASERSYQLLHQITGRAGREKGRKGTALLQSFEPKNPVMQALQQAKRKDFLDIEKQRRKQMGWPPFGKLAGLILSSHHAKTLDEYSYQLKRNAPSIKGLDILGPAPAPIAMIQKRHRRRFLIKGTKQTKMQNILKTWLAENPTPATIRIKIDIDPLSFL